MAKKIKPETLKSLCWKRGLSVSQAAAAIGRSRMNVYRAAKEPNRYRPTFRKLEELLCV